jgi:hypothetical protein
VDRQVAEPPAESLLVFGRHVLVTEHDDLVLDEGVVDGLECCVI